MQAAPPPDAVHRGAASESPSHSLANDHEKEVVVSAGAVASGNGASGPPPQADIKRDAEVPVAAGGRAREVAVKQEALSTNVAVRLQAANTRQILDGVGAWIDMWTVAKYQDRYVKKKGWHGWWLARLRNRKNEEGKLVNLMLEVTTNIPQDSPPQDFAEIYVLNPSSAASALESMRLLTPLLGDIRNKASRGHALRGLQEKCGFHVAAEHDGPAASKGSDRPAQEGGAREETMRGADAADAGGGKRRKMSSSPCNDHSCRDEAERAARSGRERKAVRRLDPAQEAERDRGTHEKHKRPGKRGENGGGCLGRGKKGAVNANTEEAADAGCEDVIWRREGNEYIGKRVRRSLWSNGEEPDSRIIGTADARVVGWLPKEESDFFDEEGNPAALWRIVYENSQIGEEDLEEYEVKESLELLELGLLPKATCVAPANAASTDAAQSTGASDASALGMLCQLPSSAPAGAREIEGLAVRHRAATASSLPTASAAAAAVSSLTACHPALPSGAPDPLVTSSNAETQQSENSASTASSKMCRVYVVDHAPGGNVAQQAGLRGACGASALQPHHLLTAQHLAAMSGGAGMSVVGASTEAAAAAAPHPVGTGSRAGNEAGVEDKGSSPPQADSEVEMFSTDVARITISSVSVASFGDHGFFLPPCRSQDLTSFRLFCIVGVPFTVGPSALFPDSIMVPPQLCWAQEYLRMDACFQQSCEYTFDASCNSMKGVFRADGECRIELVIKLTVGPSLVVGVDVYPCVIFFVVAPQLCYVNCPPNMPIVIAPNKPERIVLLGNCHLPYSNYSMHEIGDPGDGNGVHNSFHADPDWARVDGHTGAISIHLPHQFVGKKSLGRDSSSRRIHCFAIRSVGLMGWQQAQLLVELHSLPPAAPAQGMLPLVAGAAPGKINPEINLAPAGAQEGVPQSRCAARAASAVCTPVLPPNASSSLDEASGGSANTHTHRVATSAAAALVVANGTSASADASVDAAGKDRRRAAGDEETDTGAPSTPTDASAAVAARGRGATPDAGNGARAGAKVVAAVATASVVDLNDHALAVNVVAVPLDA